MEKSDLRWHKQTVYTQFCGLQCNLLLHYTVIVCKARGTYSHNFKSNSHLVHSSRAWYRDLFHHTTFSPAEETTPSMTWQETFYSEKSSLCHSKKISTAESAVRKSYLKYPRSTHLSPLSKFWISQGPKIKFTYCDQIPVAQYNRLRPECWQILWSDNWQATPCWQELLDRHLLSSWDLFLQDLTSLCATVVSPAGNER